MDCDYCQGIRPDHVRLDCGLSYPIRPGPTRTQGARGYPVVIVHFHMNIMICSIYTITHIIISRTM